MSKAFNFLTVQNEHTVDSLKVSCRNILLSLAEIIDYKIGFDFMGHSVLGTLQKIAISIYITECI